VYVLVNKYGLLVYKYVSWAWKVCYITYFSNLPHPCPPTFKRCLLMGRAVQLSSGKWVSAGSKDDTRPSGSSGGSTYVSQATETKGQEFWTGTRIPTSLDIKPGESSSDVMKRYNLPMEYAEQVSRSVIEARREQNLQQLKVQAEQVKAAKQAADIKSWNEQQTSLNLPTDTEYDRVVRGMRTEPAGVLGTVGQDVSYLSKAELIRNNLQVPSEVYSTELTNKQKINYGISKQPMTTGFEESILLSQVGKGEKPEPQFVTYKDTLTGKSVGVWTSPNIAMNEPSELGWYSKLDTSLRLVGTPEYNLGGLLPGGVSTSYAQTQYNKEYSVASDKTLKGLENRRKILEGTQVVAGGSLAVLGLAAVPSTAAALWGSKLFLGSSLVAGTAAAGIITYGTIRLSEQSYGASEKAIIDNKQMNNEINKQVGLARQKVNEQYKLSDPGGRNVADAINYAIGGYGSSELRGKTFESELTSGLKASGLFNEQQLMSAVAIGKAKRVTSIVGYVGSIVGVGAASEGVGRILLKIPAVDKASINKFSWDLAFKGSKQIKAMALPKITYATKSLFEKAVVTRAGAAIAIAGFGEGAALKTAGYMSGMDTTYKEVGAFGIPKVVYNNPITWGFGGAYSAKLIGGGVVKASLKSKSAGGYALGAAYVTDWGEPWGDVTWSFAEKINRAVFSKAYKPLGTKGSMSIGIMPKVRTPTNIFSLTKTSTPSNTPSSFKSSKGVTNALTNVFSTNVVSTRVISPSFITVPTITNINVRSYTKTNVPRSRSIIPNLINVPNIVNTPSNVPVRINNPINVPIKTTTNTLVSIFTPTSTPVSINTPVDIPITVPTIKFPFIIPGGGGGGGGWGWPRATGRVKGKYTPSLVATTFNIRGKMPSVITGLSIRPLVGKSNKRFKQVIGY